MVVQPAQSFQAEALHNEPKLENIGAARTLKTANALIDDAFRLPRVKEVWSLLRERSLQITFVPSQHQPSCERQQHHLVRIPRQRARVSQASQRARRTRREQR